MFWPWFWVAPSFAGLGKLGSHHRSWSTEAPVRLHVLMGFMGAPCEQTPEALLGSYGDLLGASGSGGSPVEGAPIHPIMFRTDIGPGSSR